MGGKLTKGEFPLADSLPAELAFRLSWPGNQVAAPAKPLAAKAPAAIVGGVFVAAGRQLLRMAPKPSMLRPLFPLKSHPRRRQGKGKFGALLPALQRKLTSRRTPCVGWPITLSAPGPEIVSFSPKVKITGKPLD